MTYKLLIVDDELPNLRLLERLFRHDYQVLTASSGDEAIKLLEQHDVATIITDQRMPEMTGIQLLKKTEVLRPHMVRILLTGYTDVEALVEAINCGLVYMYISKPWNNDDLKLRVSRAMDHYGHNKRRHSLELNNTRLLSRIEQLKTGFVRTIAEALKSRDKTIYDHSVRMSQFVDRVCIGLNLSEQDTAQISAAATLHDIGALCGSAGVACCAGCSNSEAFRLAQKQSDDGAEMLLSMPEFEAVAEMVRFQHESYDGSGKPRGLIGDQIPLGSRIMRVAAEYDFLTCPVSNSPVSHAQAIASLRQRAGRELDPEIVQIFAELTFDGLFASHGFQTQPLDANLVLQPV
jgi:response regulator RpfG family c-di-GMP phosphodiesterase